MSKVITVNNEDNTWSVYNSQTMVSATIIKIQEFGFLAKDTPTRYRVDFKGKTIASMIGNFQTAKSIARKHLLKI